MEIHDFTSSESSFGPIVERWHAGMVEALRYESGEVRVRCVYRRTDDELCIAPLGISHEVDWPVGGPPTIRPSLLVEGGGAGGVHMHGYLTDGVWHPCDDDAGVPLPDAPG